MDASFNRLTELRVQRDALVDEIVMTPWLKEEARLHALQLKENFIRADIQAALLYADVVVRDSERAGHQFHAEFDGSTGSHMNLLNLFNTGVIDAKSNVENIIIESDRSLRPVFDDLHREALFERDRLIGMAGVVRELRGVSQLRARRQEIDRPVQELASIHFQVRPWLLVQ